jgi:hypothetical protein
VLRRGRNRFLVDKVLKLVNMWLEVFGLFKMHEITSTLFWLIFWSFILEDGKTVRFVIEKFSSSLGSIFGYKKQSDEAKLLTGQVKLVFQSKLLAATEQVQKLYTEHHGDTEKVLSEAVDEPTKKLWQQVIDKIEADS